MSRQTRFVIPPATSTPIYSGYTDDDSVSASGVDGRGRSTIFPYSTAGPPSQYIPPVSTTQQSVARKSRQSINDRATYFDAATATDAAEDGTPLYARSDWGGRTVTSSRYRPGEESLYDISEEGTLSEDEQDAYAYNSQYTMRQAATQDHNRGLKRETARFSLPPIWDLDDLLQAGSRTSLGPKDLSNDTNTRRSLLAAGRPDVTQASTVPSPFAKPITPGADPTIVTGGASTGNAQSPKLITPDQQHRLGRMSVAPARYSLPPPRRQRGRTPRQPRLRGSSRAGIGNSQDLKKSLLSKIVSTASSLKDQGHSRPDSNSNSGPGTNFDLSDGNFRMPLPVEPDETRETPKSSARGILPILRKIKTSRTVIWYLTWRPFILPLLSLTSALLLTMALADDTPLGFAIIAEKGAMGVMPGDGERFGLGVEEWCELGG
jgi:hypothetical protein